MIQRDSHFSTVLKVLSFLTCLTGLQYPALASPPQPPISGTHLVSVVLECGNDSLLLCTNQAGIGNFNSLNVCQQPAHGALSASMSDSCLYYKPVSDFYGDDFACLVICDDANVCDTFQFEILVENCFQQIPCANLGFDLMAVTVDDCNDQVKVCSPFPLGDALLYDYSIDGIPYSGNIGICSYDTLYSYSFSSLPGGGNAGPYELPSWLVDGNILTGTFDDIFQMTDLMNMIDPNGNWFLDSTTMIISTFNTGSDYGEMTIVQTSTADISFLNKNSTTAPVGSFIRIPAGLHEITLVHQVYDYCVDTFEAAIHCRNIRLQFDTLEIDQTNSVCFDTSNLLGNVLTVNQVCPGCHSLELSQNGDCFTYKGLSEGTDSLLLVACDDFGFCDSTWQIVTVLDGSKLPIASPDRDTTEENSAVILDLLNNDQINGDLRNIFITEYPHGGTVTINTSFTIEYEPEKGFCGLDEFVYQICNDNGCDTAKASIMVRCRQPLVYNGFSPNGDGYNDTFKIFDIESYPSNKLSVYNRWGNLVYQKKNYQNDWSGQTRDSSLLPDGTYFYQFEVDGQATVSGYLQINR